MLPVFTMLKKNIFSLKNLALFLFQYIIMHYYCVPVHSLSERLNYPVTPWIFPFIFSNINWLFFFLLCCVYHFSDIPFQQRSNMYLFIRTGRIKWTVTQITLLLLRSFILVSINFLFCLLDLYPNIDFSLEWGKLLHTAALTNALSDYENPISVNYKTLVSFSPAYLLILVLLIGTAVIFMLGLILYLLSIYTNRRIALISVSVMIIANYILEIIHPILLQKYSKFLPVSWLKVAELSSTKMDRYMLPPLSYIFFTASLLNIVFIILLLYKCQKSDMHWNNNEDA